MLFFFRIVRLANLAVLLAVPSLGLAQQTLPALQIDSPVNGTVVNPGQTITVSVSSPSGAVFPAVIVVGEGPLEVSSIAASLPAQFSLTVPADLALRRYTLTAIGAPVAGDSVESVPIELDVERPDMPISLSSQFQTLTMEAVGQTAPMMLLANFSDGNILDVTESSNVTYQSTNTSIITVDSNGTVTGLTAGTAAITVTYINANGPNLQISIPVTVLPPLLTLAPSSLDFGNVNLGSSANLSLTVTNSSASDNSLNIKAITAAGNYLETDNCVASSPLPVGGTCGITVTFGPAAAGQNTGTITIANSSGMVPSVVLLTGVGVATAGPSITGISPATGPVGTSITIAGANFGGTQGTSTVVIGGITVTPTSWSDTSIALNIPNGLPAGNSGVTVTVNGISSNTTIFLVTPGVNSLSPTLGPVGASVTISGTSFGATQGTGTVQFNGVTATTVGLWSDTSVTAVVPTGATTGSVVVTVGGVASNGVNFTVLTPPAITSLSPTSGIIGSSVVISGSSFGATQGTVTFNGTAATTITSWNVTSITAVVPTGATTGNVVVTVGGLASNGVSFTVVTPPAITSLSPASGIIGSSVVIAGSAFGAAPGTSTVTFNGTAATTITSWSATSITAVAPTGTTTGNVVVTVGGVASNGSAFTVGTPPAITSLSPTSGIIGSSIVIAGSTFGATKGTSTVTFNGTAATAITSWSATSIAAAVPTGATTGNVVVTVGGVASNGVLFTVSSGGISGFTRVQLKSKAIGSGGASSVTVGSAQGWTSSTIGNAIIVVCGAHTGAPVPTISDNKSDTYTLLGSVTDSSPAVLAIYVLPNNSGGVTSITCTPNAFTSMTETVMELNGAASSAVLDQVVGFDNAFGVANPWTSHSTAAQSTAGDYAIGVGYEFRLGGQTFTAGSGWTAVGADNAGTIFLEEQNTASGTSSIAATGNISTTANAQVLALAATLKPASGGGVPAPSITGLTPNSGAIGSSVVIAGSNFGTTQGTSTVSFNGTVATTVSSWSSTSVTAIAPTGATTGNVVVTVGGVASNGVLFTVSSGGSSGFTHVQIKSKSIGSSGASSATVGSAQGWVPSTVGNAIIVACGTDTAAPVPTISDNKSDTYTLIKSVTDSAPATLALYILPNNPGGVSSITCTPNAFSEMTIVIMELNGAASASVTDQVSGNDNAFGGANPWTSHSTAVQSTTGDYGIGVAYEFRLGNQTFTAGSGWTAVGGDNAGTIFFEDQNPVSGTSSIAATGSISTTTNAQILAIAATIKPATSGH